MSVTLAMRGEDWAALTATLDAANETAAVLALGIADTGDSLTLLVRDVTWVPADAYAAQQANRLEILSAGWMPALGRAAARGAAAAFAHTHPGGSPRPSMVDQRLDELLSEPFRLRTGARYYVSVVIGGTPAAAEFSAVVLTQDGTRQPVTKLRVVDDRLRVLAGLTNQGADPHLSLPAPGRELFDRQVRAFGGDGQRVLAGLHVGVVGAGGTGSAVAEQLVRLGVGTITVLDDDVVTATNLTRIHGSGRADIGVSKPQLIARTAQDVGTSSIRTVPARLHDAESARCLLHCDVIFGCTDDQRGRAILNRLAYYYLIPVLDTGFVISSQDGRVSGLDGRVTVVAPGTACLLCRRRIDPTAMRVEAMSPLERAAMAAEGYAPELGEPDPSVVTYTTLVGSLAVHEMLGRLFDYAGAHPPSELLLRVHERQVRTNTVAGQTDHFCTDRQIWGRGDTVPLLEQVWA